MWFCPHAGNNFIATEGWFFSCLSPHQVRQVNKISERKNYRKTGLEFEIVLKNLLKKLCLIICTLRSWILALPKCFQQWSSTRFLKFFIYLFIFSPCIGRRQYKMQPHKRRLSSKWDHSHILLCCWLRQWFCRSNFTTVELLAKPEGGVASGPEMNILFTLQSPWLAGHEWKVNFFLCSCDCGLKLCAHQKWKKYFCQVIARLSLRDKIADGRENRIPCASICVHPIVLWIRRGPQCDFASCHWLCM